MGHLKTYAASVVQMIEGHTALIELAVKKDWLKPYELPSKQLSCAINCANDTVSKK